MAGVADIAKKAGLLVVVDNIFATPILQKPLNFGADVIVYSGTKLNISYYLNDVMDVEKQEEVIEYGCVGG